MSRFAASLTLAPGAIWLLMFLLLPMCFLIGLSFFQVNTLAGTEIGFSLENYRRFLGWDLFGYDPLQLQIFARSVLIATVTTVLCLILGIPLAFFIAQQAPEKRLLWLMLVIAPSLVNTVIRCYAWIIILNPQSALSGWLVGLHLLDADTVLYPGMPATYIGMLNLFLPFVVLPLYSAIERIDWDLYRAARDLYASALRAFRHAVVPQFLPGLVAAVIITFFPAMGMFLVTDILGGAKANLIGNSIQQQFGAARDWPFGATLACIVIVLTLLCLGILAQITKKYSRKNLI